MWLEAMVPAVEPEEEAEIHRVAESVAWDPKPGSDKINQGVKDIKNSILARKPYMRMS